MNRAIIGLVAVLSSFTVLHSGRTDGNGGHFNHSTGEYHYHHGYSAHDHYDMNGDGVLDCPYSFKDNTTKKNTTAKSESKTNIISESPKNKDRKPSSATVAVVVLAVITLADFIISKFRK
jgi:hypothetical protein